MDRLIAFGAGAVLAFGLGYLVSYQVNTTESTTVDRARLELEQSGDDGTGLIDAKTPKLKSLADLANQNDEALATELSAVEVRDLKSMLLPHLTPADIAGWQTSRDAYLLRFLSANPGPWAVSSDEAAGDRLDADIAAAAEGQYEGKISLPEVLGDAGRSYDLTLDLTGFKGGKPEGRMSLHTADGTPVWGVQFRWKLVGTDAKTRTLWVILPPFIPEVASRASYFALSIPVDLDVGKATNGELLGLSQDLTWGRVGSFELLKAK